MKKSNLELVKWLMAKMETNENELTYARDRNEREKRDAEENEREPEKYYQKELERYETEKRMLLEIFELI